LRNPIPSERLVGAATIAAAYIAGGFIPLGLHIVPSTASAALEVSVVITLSALAAFGYVKGRFTGAPPLRSAIQTTVVSGLSFGPEHAIKQGAAGCVQVVEPRVRFALVHTEPRAWLPVVVGQPEARAFSQLYFQTWLFRLTLNASLRESFCPGNKRAQEKTTLS